MKRQTLSVFAMLSLMVTMALASGYAQDKVVADIPFQFAVGNKSLPAGEYSVTQLSPAVMLIKSDDGSGAAMALANPAQANKAPDEAKLVFHRYGDQYFLFQVWTPGSNTGREVAKSKLERELARRQLAHNASQRLLVYVTGRMQ